jgi:hypothetical protein
MDVTVSVLIVSFTLWIFGCLFVHDESCCSCFVALDVLRGYLCAGS